MTRTRNTQASKTVTAQAENPTPSVVRYMKALEEIDALEVRCVEARAERSSAVQAAVAEIGFGRGTLANVVTALGRPLSSSTVREHLNVAAGGQRSRGR